MEESHMHDFEAHVRAVEEDLEYYRAKRIEPRIFTLLRRGFIEFVDLFNAASASPGKNGDSGNGQEKDIEGRVRALEEAGLIKGYHADVDAKELGFGVIVFAQVGLSSQAEADLEKFEKLVSSWPEVRECHMLAGETDFLLKIVAKDWETYNQFLTTRLTSAPNVSQVKSALAIRSAKLLPGVPIDAD